MQETNRYAAPTSDEKSASRRQPGGRSDFGSMPAKPGGIPILLCIALGALSGLCFAYANNDLMPKRLQSNWFDPLRWNARGTCAFIGGAFGLGVAMALGLWQLVSESIGIGRRRGVQEAYDQEEEAVAKVEGLSPAEDRRD